MEILTQKEINELIATLSSGVIADKGAKPKGRSRPVVRVYDFRRPDKFSKEQIRTIQMIHENMARSLAGFLTSQYRAMVQVSLVSVEQKLYQEFIQEVQPPTLLVVFRLEPLPGNAVLEITRGVSLPLIERLLGGPGILESQLRDLTEIERAIMDRVILGILRNLAEAWRNIIDLSPSMENMESNPLFVQAVMANDMVIVVSIEVRMGDQSGLLNVCLPFLLMEPIMPKLSAQHWFAADSRRDIQETSRQVREAIGDTPIEVIAVLKGGPIPLRDLLSLSVGDVLVFDRQAASSEVDVMVGSLTKFKGVMGLSGRKLAVLISSVIYDGEADTARSRPTGRLARIGARVV